MINIFFKHLALSLGTLLVLSCEQSKGKQQTYLDAHLKETMKTDTATFGTGCFWCTEAIFQELKGVVSATSGYSGGNINNPTYEQVCTGTTGHAECIQVIYNPTEITYDELLEVFWKVHDPTTLNQQGADIGPQYRSVIFYHSEDQKQKAESYKTVLNNEKAFDKPIITAIEPFKNFFAAENYHQNFYSNNPNYGYCRIVIKPKLDKFEKIFKDKLRKN